MYGRAFQKIKNIEIYIYVYKKNPPFSFSFFPFFFLICHTRPLYSLLHFSHLQTPPSSPPLFSPFFMNKSYTPTFPLPLFIFILPPHFWFGV